MRGDVTGWKTDRRSRQARGYGAAWDRARKAAMNRDGWLCQACRREGRVTPATECDHIVPKHKGGTDALDNLQAICAPCHKAKTEREAAEAQGRTHRAKMQFDDAGFPIWPEGR